MNADHHHRKTLKPKHTFYNSYSFIKNIIYIKPNYFKSPANDLSIISNFKIFGHQKQITSTTSFQLSTFTTTYYNYTNIKFHQKCHQKFQHHSACHFWRREASYAHGQLSGVACQVPGSFSGLFGARWHFAEGRQPVESRFGGFHDTWESYGTIGWTSHGKEWTPWKKMENGRVLRCFDGYFHIPKCTDPAQLFTLFLK